MSVSSDQNHHGAVLKKAREKKRVSLNTVHEATKIPLDVLRAIEEDYEVRTVSSFYRKGFVKIYAKYLGIPLEELGIKEQGPSQQPSEVKLKVPPLRFQFDWRNILSRRKKQQAIKIIGVLFVVFVAWKFFAPSGEKKTKEKAPTPPRATVVRETAPARRVAPRAVAAKRAEPHFDKAVTLSVRAKQNSWLQVKADKVTVFQAVLRKGDTETWSADDNIEISGRNVSQLEFELNGKMIGGLGRADRRAKKILVTKDGLSVRR